MQQCCAGKGIPGSDNSDPAMCGCIQAGAGFSGQSGWEEASKRGNQRGEEGP